MSVIEQARAQGYTHVQTYGGAIPLEAWRPYGKTPEDPNRYAISFYLGDGFIGETALNAPRNATAGPEGMSPSYVTGRWLLLNLESEESK